MKAIQNKENSKISKMGRGKHLMATMTMLTVMSFAGMAFAGGGDAATLIQNIMGQMIDIVGLIFQAVGVILSVYSVGQLVMAFKNEDADSKSRASTMLVVGICLIAIPALVKNLGLVNMIGS